VVVQSVCVCVSFMFVSHAKTAEPIEMPFGVVTWMGPKNHELDGIVGAPMPQGKGAILGGKVAANYNAYGHITASCAKTAEPMQMPFCNKTRVGKRNHVLDGGADPPGEGVILGVVHLIENHCNISCATKAERLICNLQHHKTVYTSCSLED